MNEPKLFERPELTEAEEDNALMPFVSENDTSGRWRWKNIRGFFASLHRRNPLEVVWEETTLYEPTTPVLDDNYAITYNLDIRQGANRHSFADGYTHFKIFWAPTAVNFIEKISIYTLIDAKSVMDSTQTAPLNFIRTDSKISNFARNSNTSFKISGQVTTSDTQEDSDYLVRIVGLKMIVRPSTL